MKHVFFDANILIDFVGRRPYNGIDLEGLLDRDDEFKFYISAVTAHICAYVLKLKRDSKEFQVFSIVLENINIIPLNSHIIHKAVETDYKDFEDLLQYFCAVEYCDTIFTRDRKDFEKIKVLTNSDIKIIDKY